MRGRRVAVEEWLRHLAGQWFFMVGISTVMLGLLAAVGDAVLEHESTAFDNAVHMWVVTHQNPVLLKLFLVITWLGSSVPVITIAIALAAWLWHSRGRRVAAVVAVAAATAAALFLVVKQLFHRVRPPGAIIYHITTYSFPSGHATTAAAIFVTAAYVLRRESLISRGLAITLGVAGPLLIGISRVYLDVHWATDVLGGWAAGLFVAALSVVLYDRLRSRARLEPRPTV